MNKKIGIWGLGIVGKSAIRYFYAKNYDIRGLDKRQPTMEEQQFLDAHNATFYTKISCCLFSNTMILFCQAVASICDPMRNLTINGFLNWIYFGKNAQNQLLLLPVQLVKQP